MDWILPSCRVIESCIIRRLVSGFLVIFRVLRAAVIAGLQDQIQSKEQQLEAKDQLILSSQLRLKKREEELKEALRRIEYLEELNRLYRAQKFGRSSEKNSYQILGSLIQNIAMACLCTV